MVSTLGALVLFLTCAGSTIGQRKVSRNISVGTREVKYTVNFDCPDEFGYYPHPSDCTQYYVCVFGGALLESCTGGLMYSHELQTCDWPRNVGCDGTGEVAVKATVSSSSTPSRSSSTESRTRYTPRPPPPPAQPAAVVTSRGQPRQLHHNQQQQEIIKSHQLYAEEEEEALPPPSEEISDRQQRFYRGQPSTVGQVQRDRDGIRHTNAIPSYSGRGEKIGVISFGTQQQQLQSYSDLTDVSNNDLTNDVTLTRRKIRHKRQAQRRLEDSSVGPQKIAATVAPKTVHNGSQHYDPARYEQYYFYDDDIDTYRDLDYSQHYNANNADRQTFRGTPATTSHLSSTPKETTKRRPTYIQSSYTAQDVYPSADYNEDNTFGQVDDQSSYRQTSQQPSRGDRNELNYVEEPSTTKRAPTITRTTTTTTTTTTPRPIPSQKSTVPSRSPVRSNVNSTRAQLVPNTLPEDPGHILPSTTLFPNILSNRKSDVKTEQTYRHSRFDETSTHAVTAENFENASRSLTTPKPMFHFITKASKAGHYSFRERERSNSNRATTTYAPPKFIPSARNNLSESRVTNNPDTNSFSSPSPLLNASVNQTNLSTNKKHVIIKMIRKFINPIAINNEFSGTTDDYQDSSEENTSSERPKTLLHRKTTTQSATTTNKPLSIQTSTTTTITPIATTTSSKLALETTARVDKIKVTEKLRYHVEPSLYVAPNNKQFHTTVEIPEPRDVYINEEDLPKPEPDQPPSYKPKPVPKIPSIPVTKPPQPEVSRNATIPARVSRVNTAIKSLIAFVGTRRPNTKCTDNQTPNVKCNDVKQRTSSRGRGSAHYSSAGIVEAVNVNTVNRGTAPPRSRPTLKPSTSIVSKAAEYIDIYRYPPRRPETIYPQPQPDKTAAKCRKDVCLLPDCSCGGKEIPGDLPVEQVPQIVLLTYDDSVNDLNKGLYSDLFEKGRVNPNGCPIAATFYVSHEWTDYSQVQNLYADGHEIASHTVSHSFGEQFSQKKWTREVAGQREILSAYGGVKLEDVRGMRAPFLSVGGNKMFKMLYDSNFTYDSSLPVYENKPPSWPYTLDYKLFHDCMIPPCPTRSYPGVWEVPMVMWQDLNGGRCSMGDACSNPADPEGVFKLLMKNFQRHYTTNRAPFGLFYHAAWFTQPHHKEGFINFLDTINAMKDVYLVTNWQAIQWVREPTPLSQIGHFQPFQCNYPDRPKRCNNPKVCNLWHKSGVRYMRTCQPCPDIYPWTGNTGIRSSRIDNDIED